VEVVGDGEPVTSEAVRIGAPGDVDPIAGDTTTSAAADGAIALGYAKWVHGTPRRSSIRPVERSTSSAVSVPEASASTRWVWVWEPIVTRPVETISANPLQETGHPSSGNGRPRSTKSVDT
jgi:hypothetical protein